MNIVGAALICVEDGCVLVMEVIPRCWNDGGEGMNACPIDRMAVNASADRRTIVFLLGVISYQLVLRIVPRQIVVRCCLFYSCATSFTINLH